MGFPPHGGNQPIKQPPDVTALSNYFFFFFLRMPFLPSPSSNSCVQLWLILDRPRTTGTPPRLHSEILGDVPLLDKLSICFPVILIWVKLLLETLTFLLPSKLLFQSLGFAGDKKIEWRKIQGKTDRRVVKMLNYDTMITNCIQLPMITRCNHILLITKCHKLPMITKFKQLLIITKCNPFCMITKCNQVPMITKCNQLSTITKCKQLRMITKCN